jgi:hypothetical protein
MHVPAEGDGTKVYASCLSFYDPVPHALATKHEDLLGAVALKAICLLSHQPYLTTADKAGSTVQETAGTATSSSCSSCVTALTLCTRQLSSAEGLAGSTVSGTV